MIDSTPFSGEIGKDYGNKVHNFAERYVKYGDVEPENVDEENIKNFIDGLEGKLLAEEMCLLPIERGGRKILFQGVIDLLDMLDNKINIVDYKTDRSKDALQEYFKQLSIYSVSTIIPSKACTLRKK